ncbi:TIGR04086 family membrane protein [Dethiothermospora halolimnae]|uniref:TIGR04086 family membrane protein n=1 Tax=Dethiothermospora halolimnae TaxID=3114390 RepID=UPI003CCBEA37
MRQNISTGNKSYGINLVKGLIFSYIITIVLIFIASLILTYTDLSIDSLSVIKSIIMILSIALGAIYLSMKNNKKGWLNGGIVGLLYVVIMIIIGSIINNSFSLDSYVLIKLIIALITGAIGGMIGVNLK